MAKKLWGGRFKKKIDKDFNGFQKSIQYDYKLAKYDVVHSLIHVTALNKIGLLSSKEKNKLIGALKEIQNQIRKSKFRYDPDSEDIHTDIQNKIEKKVGKLALKLHTLRSRNDQVVFDEKWYCYDESAYIEKLSDELLKSLNLLKNKYRDVSIVGYTHIQRAQKVSFGDYLDAYYLMFERDKKRLNQFWQNLDIYIGAGALAGSPIPKSAYSQAIKEIVDSKTKTLFKPFVNSLDNVSDRDFIVEFLSILSIIQMHLSRLSEDFILYSTKEFGFFKLPEEFCTGSSLLPHKKNPDFLELVRGYVGRINGNLISILTTMKGLPLTYNKDMQLDKEPLFSSVEIVKDELKIMAHFIRGIKLNKDAIKEALKDVDLYTVQKVETLVRKGIPFKEAHNIVGRQIRNARV